MKATIDPLERKDILVKALDCPPGRFIRFTDTDSVYLRLPKTRSGSPPTHEFLKVGDCSEPYLLSAVELGTGNLYLLLPEGFSVKLTS